MDENSFIAALQHLLPVSVLPWVVAALRQDPVIWRCLQSGDFRDRALSRPSPDQVELWTPAALALLALDLPHTPQQLSADIHYPLESRLRRKAACASGLRAILVRLAEGKRAAEVNPQTAPLPSVDDLAQAGLLALALRERRRVAGSWEGLLDDFKKIGAPLSFWQTPVACLYGLVPDPMEMLVSILSTGTLPGQVSLTSHALLANPAPPEQTVETVLALLKKSPQSTVILFLSELAGQRPALASELARYILRELWNSIPSLSASRASAIDPMDDLQALTHLMYSAQAHHLAGDLPRALLLLRAAQQASHHLYAGITAGIALTTQEQDPTAALNAWENALRLEPDNLQYRARLAQTLLDLGRIDEARRWLGENEGTLQAETDSAPAALLPAMISARLAAAEGDIEHARQTAGRILANLQTNNGEKTQQALSTINSWMPATALPKLLMDLGMANEAAQAAQCAQASQPANIDLLTLEGQAWMRAGNPYAAAQALQVAIALAPDQPDLRRQLAEAQETSGDWQAALEQRTWVVESSSEGGATVTDLRALARCALQAGQPQSTIQACQAILRQDAEDGLTHLIFGQALAATGDAGAALEHYLQATQLTPNLAQPWLALARLQHDIGQGQRALETLRAAAQELPDSAEIHLALGEAYLEDWEGRGLPAPTQALACFQRAALLAPDNACVGLRLGQTLLELGHPLEARQALERAYLNNPAFPELAHAYALTLVTLGEMVAALPVLDSLSHHPAYSRDTCLHLAHARALLSAHGDPRQAVAALQRVLSLDPGCIEAQALLAEALIASGEMAAAVQAFQAAMETDLIHDPVWRARLSLGLGQAALALERHDIAVAALQEAAQADPHDPAIARRLAEASYSAGLLNNALQAARTALRLTPDDLDTLAWFAELIMTWIARSEDSSGAGAACTHSGNLTPSAAAQLRTEAYNALTRALQIDPQRVDLLVRLGIVQMRAGEHEAAIKTFHTIATSAFAAPNDLRSAAYGLLELGDATGAVSCLEKAIGDQGVEGGEQAPASDTQSELLEMQMLLTTAYERAGNVSAALSTVETALAKAPENLALHRAKARLLLKLGQPEKALACVQAAIQLLVDLGNAPGSAEAPLHDLYYIAARLLRSLGDLPAALSHAEQILVSSDPAAPGPWTLPAQVLAAELAYSLLLTERARALLGAPPEHAVPSDRAENYYHHLQYFCLRAELALDANEDVLAAESLARASEALAGAVRADGTGFEGLEVESTPSYEILQARLSAIQARLNSLHGEIDIALETLQEASRAVLSSSSARGKPSLATLLSLGEAALQLEQWEMALLHFQRAAEAAPHEPLAHLNLARALVLRAEIERLYGAVEAIRHAPGDIALNQRSYEIFEHAIDAAHQQISQWLTLEGRKTELMRQPSSTGQLGNRSAPYRRNDVIQAQSMVSRWRARGQAAFHPSLQSTQALSATLAILTTTPDDVAAQIAALRASVFSEPGRSGETRSNRPLTTPLAIADPAAIAVQAARAYPRHPLVLIQLALILSMKGESMPEAVNAIQQAVKYQQPGDPVETPDKSGQAAQDDRRSSAVRAFALTPCLLPGGLWPVSNALLARLARSVGDTESARQAIQEALACWPEEPRWQILAAEIETANHNLEAAIAHLEQAVSLEPNHLAHFLALGRAYLRLFNPSNSEDKLIRLAIRTLEEACRLAPENPEPWLALAEAQRAAGFLDRAAESAERAIDLNPEAAQPRLLRAEIALQAGEAQTACDWAQTALRLEDAGRGLAGAGASLLLARAFEQLERPIEALNVLEKALQHSTHPLPLALERIPLLRKLHGPRAASDALQELATQYPGEASVLSLLAFAQEEAGQKESAIRSAQLALQAAANQTQQVDETLPGEGSVDIAGLHALLGRLLSQAGQLDSAIHHLNEAIRLAPHMLEAYLELGRALQERRQHSQALQVYSQATRVAPRDPRPFYQAGLALKDSKDYLGAENMLRRASALAPDDLNIHRQLGAVVALNLVHNRSGARRTNA